MAVYQRPPKLSESIAQQLKDDIIKGIYLPGERLKIIEIARRFGVSQTSVREALKILEKSDLVSESPHKGYVVTNLTLDELVDIWTIKEKLWSLAFAWFTERADKELIKDAEKWVSEFRNAYIENDLDRAFEANFAFTDVILAGCGSRKLVTLLRSIEDQVKRYRYLSLEFDDNLKVSSQYFGEIIKAIWIRDSKKVSTMIQEYIRFSQKVLKENYKYMQEKSKEKMRKEQL
ncbi:MULTISPECIES: GntR family transcriptional regulator [Pseudothermotoga]|jgi:DNA-binding GntR family transcriptional regulator|uniref:Transcriptional regulator, GntR family n=1 Tax=Pseudothermotoga lettingae (strain ATCC BAA-301 / DSM 14385 / NBRC 107922 / TMO) TaxID=416591 RepID=A8F3U5_PSELT|nr:MULTISPECIES: GntR family transcriptional regulator [Pseudothermotoga]ABV32829.1 transcriptional regulator, GntR family [Pseudothermotoga lettingae TMO]KUK21101.1 MAG: Transcriptional regulator, GntR family [Pseudothermotoga lettingae]MDI3494108.1 hypothetical protein [Pseudothermotoga sp.]MDK2885160.1 hypothetical protein [Pseudothermotoga sp.]GLI48175.1 GntR family transcriptional regulator [Pseudothermotoga lettingae TMO]